jgi:predicted ArsR family transcriptional regulator
VKHAEVDETTASLLASPTRRAIIATLEQAGEHGGPDGEPSGAGGRTAAQLAMELGLHVTTARFHLDLLERAGMVVSHFTSAFGVGRPRKVYAVPPVPDEPDSSAAHLTLLAGLLTESFTADVTPEEAGRRWAREHIPLRHAGPAATPGVWLAKIGWLVDVLRRWGYHPDLSTGEGGRAYRIELADCPFLDLARANPEVVCGIHRGLLAGALGQFGEDLAEVSLTPFVGPRMCHAQIRARQPFDNRAEEPTDEP